MPRFTVDAKSAGEPVLEVPLPPGWQRSTEMVSEMVRAAIVNTGLRANDFSPNAVVTLEDLTGKVPSVQQGVAAEIAAVEHGGATVTSRTAGAVCGYPSGTITYTLKNRSVTALIVVAEHEHKIWAAVVTVQTTEPDNPTYAAGKNAILEGFQFTVPGENP
ncbi:LpqN/LpqT family lipoprotein [Mycobacteroides abscessus]|uniref:LpqN/LpqT family lipoprotein n=1 Tax=Mycobacteroides abscessus TaxID=36809 RepID=UPI001F46F3C2|nr:LpqN/LpqT family lipoprotein [Mycobacteroides abscessus]